MSEEKKKTVPHTAWRKGESSPNPAGRPKGTGKPVSKLRRTLNKLYALEDKSLENIQKSVEGQEVDKESLSTSRWVVNTIVNVNRAALSEELAIHGIRQKDNELADEVEKEQEAEEPVVKFSLVQLPTKSDL